MCFFLPQKGPEHCDEFTNIIWCKYPIDTRMGYGCEGCIVKLSYHNGTVLGDIVF